MVHIGIDLAWNARVRTGLAVFDVSGGLVDSASVRTDDEIDAWLGRHSATLVNVAIDAPLIVVNATGMRPAEKQIGAAFWQYDASCYPANTSNPHMNPPRATSLSLRHGWNVDPAHVGTTQAPACIEVYPTRP